MGFLLAFEFIILIWFWNLCEHAYLFLILFSALANAANLSAQVNEIPMLNGSNFKIWKENVEIVLGCIELDLELRIECPTSTLENLNEANIEKWERSNCLSLMLMKRSIPEAFWGSINESVNATKFLLDIEQVFARRGMDPLLWRNICAQQQPVSSLFLVGSVSTGLDKSIRATTTLDGAFSPISLTFEGPQLGSPPLEMH